MQDNPDQCATAEALGTVPDEPFTGSARDVVRLTGIPLSTLVKLRLYRPKDSPPNFRIGTRVYYPLRGVDSLETWLADRMSAARAVAL